MHTILSCEKCTDCFSGITYPQISHFLKCDMGKSNFTFVFTAWSATSCMAEFVANNHELRNNKQEDYGRPWSVNKAGEFWTVKDKSTE